VDQQEQHAVAPTVNLQFRFLTSQATELERTSAACIEWNICFSFWP
jgi:hypothetical protein